MAGETRKQNVAKEYIKENVLNKELVELQGSILGELNLLQKKIKSGDMFNFKKLILGSEGEGGNDDEIENEEKIFGLDEIMKILFNEEGKQRSVIGYKFKKTLNLYGIFGLISDKGKENLDLLYESLNKAKSEQELRDLLSVELSQLEIDVVGNNNAGNRNRGDENLSSIENKEQHQVSEQYIYRQAQCYGVTDSRQIAYILAIVKGECAFKNIKEIGGENKSYGKVDSSTGMAYYGRGFLQLTHKSNYEKYTKIIRESGLKFKDNNGNILTSQQLDLVKNPDTVLESNDLASFILIDWMKNGGPYRQEDKKLSYYINDDKLDFFNARYIINGDKNYVRNGKKVGDMYKGYAEDYLSKIGNGVETRNVKNILIEGSPELLAKKNTELGGLGNSMMTGFQGYYNKTKFPNMDGVEGKNTQNHPRRFTSKQDVIDYKNNHPEVKSFMFYFGANTRDNIQTLGDITQWGEWMEEVGIQPVLCTCIGEDNHPWLIELNQMIIKRGKDKHWPVLDFAKSYNKGQIAMGNNQHPTGVGYNAMSDMIDECLA